MLVLLPESFLVGVIIAPRLSRLLDTTCEHLAHLLLFTRQGYGIAVSDSFTVYWFVRIRL